MRFWRPRSRSSSTSSIPSLEEAKQAERAKENHDQKQKILGILAEKQDADLRNKTPEELQAMLNQLG